MNEKIYFTCSNNVKVDLRAPSGLPNGKTNLKFVIWCSRRTRSRFFIVVKFSFSSWVTVPTPSGLKSVKYWYWLIPIKLSVKSGRFAKYLKDLKKILQNCSCMLHFLVMPEDAIISVPCRINVHYYANYFATDSAEN